LLKLSEAPGNRYRPDIHGKFLAGRLGPFENGYESYAALGRWVEDNDYVLAGPAREEFIVLPTRTPDEAVVEIQLPVAPAGDAPRSSDLSRSSRNPPKVSC